MVVMLCSTLKKRQDDAEVKKEEVALRQQELALQQKRPEQFEAQMLQQQQFNLQL